MTDRVLCVVQARTGSTRLPGKVLRDLGGKPMLRFMLDRLDALAVDQVVVATSDLERDDAVADIARDAGREVVRGSEADVLSRFATALDAFPADHVVRLTADCPLADPDVVEQTVALHLTRAADYTSNVLPRTYPKGLDVEVAVLAALRTAHNEAHDLAEREHVMPFLYRRPSRFRLANHRTPVAFGRLGHERWTVDTDDDLERLRAIVEQVGRDGRFSWQDAFAVVGAAAVPPAGALALRPAGATDCWFVLACRNDDSAVAWSRQGRRISDAEHAQWYADHLDDPAVRLWIAERNDEPIGTVRVDVRDSDTEVGVGEVGIALAPSHRGHGLAAPLLAALHSELRGDPQVVTLVAHVHGANEPSRRAFERAGFRAEAADGNFTRLRG